MKKYRVVIASKSNNNNYSDADFWVYSYGFIDFIKTLISEIKLCKQYNRTITRIYFE